MNAPLALPDFLTLSDAWNPEDPFGDEAEAAEEALWSGRALPGESVPLILSRQQRFCLCCSAPLPLSGRSDRLTCTDNCRGTASYRSKTMRQTFTLIARIIEDAGPPPGRPLPLWWGLLQQLLGRKPAAGLCLRCAAPCDGPTCSRSCREKSQRMAASLAPFVDVVLGVVAGNTRNPGEAPQQWWGLAVRLFQRERAIARAEVVARRLPGGAR